GLRPSGGRRLGDDRAENLSTRWFGSKGDGRVPRSGLRQHRLRGLDERDNRRELRCCGNRDRENYGTRETRSPREPGTPITAGIEETVGPASQRGRSARRGWGETELVALDRSRRRGGQCPRVTTRVARARDDAIVTGGFAVSVYLPQDEPHGRMQSGDAAGDRLQQSQPVVATLEMGLFVHDDLVQFVIAERLYEWSRDEDDRRPAKSQCAGARPPLGNSNPPPSAAGIACAHPHRQTGFTRHIE